MVQNFKEGKKAPIQFVQKVQKLDNFPLKHKTKMYNIPCNKRQLYDGRMVNLPKER